MAEDDFENNAIEEADYKDDAILGLIVLELKSHILVALKALQIAE
ncbi:16040_t:CDS:2, partial [Cetraspora pellucida]